MGGIGAARAGLGSCVRSSESRTVAGVLFGRVLGVGGSLVQLRAGFGGHFGAVGASAPPVGDSGRKGLRGEAQNHTQK